MCLCGVQTIESLTGLLLAMGDYTRPLWGRAYAQRHRSSRAHCTSSSQFAVMQKTCMCKKERSVFNNSDTLAQSNLEAAVSRSKHLRSHFSFLSLFLKKKPNLIIRFSSIFLAVSPIPKHTYAGLFLEPPPPFFLNPLRQLSHPPAHTCNPSEPACTCHLF